MKLVDLTHPVTPNMPVYPGTEPPVFTTGCSIDEVGFLEKKITLYSHTGTHIDAPAHLIKCHNTLDMLTIDHFYGPALMLNFDNSTAETIGVKQLEPYQDKIKTADFLLLHTGWSQYWGFERYFSKYPVLSLEAANWLSSFNLKGIGLDTISADSADTEDYPVHKILLQKNTLIIENLTNLYGLHSRQFDFSCFPLSFEDADGSPVRAVAFIE
jgi:arylformamidase